ncbi:hybrid sensor histidine kinase/response regulator transcription factor [Chryseolinea soli]|uniref:histidine kinase n=1 Tax=Chryseolinea soli TaxID=2321403 RepID=A0A385SNY8_9BACT|nr:hybrid sensor histidine kinase/response regulator transcription factor [Chryseolinea soli]AYB31655.1 hybrid sensor histidine kinase/response regulator [Chryseolinea soli]
MAGIMFGVLLLTALSNLVQGDSASPWPFQHVDKRAKLSNSAITSVYMDQYDYVWLGTWDGLNRYDGSSIKVYKPDPFLKGTISNNIIRNFLEDGKGNLWIVTHQGINKYNRTTDSFQTYLDSLNDIPFLEYNIRACIGADSAVWTSLIGKGISRYAAEKNAFMPVNFEGVDASWLRSVINLGQHEGLLYLLGSDGKLVCTVNNRLVFSKQLANRKPIAFHTFLRLGTRYLLAIATTDGQLLLYDLADAEKGPDHIDLGSVTVSSLSENLDHTALWLGTEAGDIFKITEAAEGLSVKSMNSYFPAFSKAHIKILTITETKQDIVWVGTDGDGVYKFLTRAKTFYSIPKGQPENGQLSHSIIRSVYEDNAGTLYIGTRGGGLNIINPGQTKTKIVNTTNGLSNNAVLSINKDHEGNIWVGLDGEGIDMIEAGTHKIFHFPEDFENDNDLSFSSVYAICVDAFNDIWLGTSGYGIIHLKVIKTPRGYRLKEYDQLSHPDKGRPIWIKSNIVYAIVEEKPNTLWFGTRGGGVYRYNALTKKIEDHIQADPRDKNRLSNNDVLSLYLDQHEQLWIGTSGGLNRLFLQSRPYRLEHFTQHEGLPNNTIHGILEDPKGNIWLSTNHGLVMHDAAKNTFKNFDTNDGLQNNEFTDGAAFRSRTSEKLFFGGIEGLDVVYPTKVNTQSYFPRLTVTEFQVRNAVIMPRDGSQILTENIDRTENVTLKYDQNFISFFFTTLDYWNKQKSEYAYFLENFDKDWNYIGQQQAVTLTNIPPGQYKLNINYTNENGDWAPLAKTINIIVTPPFWKTYWAYGFYILLAIALQLGIILYIRRRTRAKKALAIEKFKALQLKELNDYKLQFFTNVAHEFRTPLTLILGPVASLLHKNKDVNDQQQLKTVYSNSLRLQKLIDELIQFRKIESGKDMLTLSTIDLVPFTQEIVESFQQHATDYEVHLEFYPEPESLPARVDYKKIEKILINLISNGIKYNTKGGMISVSLKEREGRAFFTIRDEGIGIAEENRNKIFESFYHNPAEVLDPNGFAKSTGIGLSLTKSMVQIHRGEIQVESKIGKGSTFTVMIPVAREYYLDLPEENAMILPSSNLVEKISLEFDTNHYVTDQPEKALNAAANAHAYSLLVVDDNVNIISLLENMLSDKYKIYKARNGKKALEILEEERIDLVISDVIMPDMDGLTLCKNIKEDIQSSHIPVILLTAKGEIENRIEGLQVGADSYIPKPFHPEHLFIRIEKLIERMELIRKKFKNLDDLELTHLSTGIGEKDDDFFSKITECIQLHLSEPEFNADTIAEHVSMSKASLYKKVKTITGMTPHGLIKQYRLKKAADLLRNTNLSVSEVIYETGFNSRSYFYKSFNEMFHCHPKDFDRAKGA